MKKYLLLILFLSGYASASEYDKKMDTWLGSNQQEMVATLGYPTRTFTAPNGNTVYSYEYTAQITIPQYVTPQSALVSDVGRHSFVTTAGGTVFGGFAVNSYCNTYFEVDSKGTIISWQYKGNCQ